MPDVVYARPRAPEKRMSPAHGMPMHDDRPMSDPSDLLVRELPLIERITRAICRRNGMEPDPTDEFLAEVRLRLVRDDYAIIRAYEGRSLFATYIAAVVRRMLIDSWRREAGKWHASAEAERLGDIGIAVERALHLEGRTVEEAHRMLAIHYPGLSVVEIERIAGRLPPRARRLKVDLDEAVLVEAPAESDDIVRNETAARISKVVCAFIDTLPHDDQLLFHLRFDCEMTVAQIARSLHRDQQLLYRRLYKHFRDLRDALTAAGIDARAVEDLIGSDSAFLDFRLKKRSLRPSEGDESAVASRQEDTSS